MWAANHGLGLGQVVKSTRVYWALRLRLVFFHNVYQALFYVRCRGDDTRPVAASPNLYGMMRVYITSSRDFVQNSKSG